MTDKLKLSSETLRELQLKQLDSLLFFKDFCKKNDLTFFLCGGCCIGALRTGGFIPWDDDIDIIMPRADYELMLKLWKKQVTSQRFLLLKTDDEIFTGNIFATVVDTKYTCVKANQANIDVPHGLVMDIFPMDASPDKKAARYVQYFWTMVYSLFLAQIVPENHGGIVAFCSKVLLGMFKSKKTRNKLWRYAEKQMTRYDIDQCENMADLCAGPVSMRRQYPKQIFDSAVMVDFEGHKMPIPAGYDEYLTIAFGDYMAMPPEEEQIPHHDLVYLDLNTPCREWDKQNKKN